KATFAAAPKTLNDIWNLPPYENYIVTGQLCAEEIKAAMEEVFDSHEKRNLPGFEVKTQGRGDQIRIVSMTLANGRPVDPGPKYAIRSEEHTSELQSLAYLVCRLLLEKKKK